MMKKPTSKQQKRTASSVLASSTSATMQIERRTLEKTFLEAHVLPCIEFSKPLKMEEFDLLKCGNFKHDHTNYSKFVLKHGYTPPKFSLTGTINRLVTTPLLVASNRSSQTLVRMDQYEMTLTLDSDIYNQACQNLKHVKEKYSEHLSALLEISRSALFRKDELDLEKRLVRLDLSGLKRSDELYASKTVAGPHALPPGHHMLPFVPDKSHPQTAGLKYLSGFELRATIPVFDKDGTTVGSETLPTMEEKEGTVYFYIVQQTFNNAIHLKIELICLSVDTSSDESPAKRARLASLT